MLYLFSSNYDESLSVIFMCNYSHTHSSELPHNIRIIYYLVLTCKDLINNVVILESIYSLF